MDTVDKYHRQRNECGGSRLHFIHAKILPGIPLSVILESFDNLHRLSGGENFAAYPDVSRHHRNHLSPFVTDRSNVLETLSVSGLKNTTSPAGFSIRKQPQSGH